MVVMRLKFITGWRWHSDPNPLGPGVFRGVSKLLPGHYPREKVSFLQREVDRMQSALLPTQNPACRETGLSSSLRNCLYLLVLNSASGKLMIVPLVAMPKALWMFRLLFINPLTLPSSGVRPLSPSGIAWTLPGRSWDNQWAGVLVTESKEVNEQLTRPVAAGESF